MLRTYEGTLKDNHIDWRSPGFQTEAHVYITVLDEEENSGRRGCRMAAALKDIAQTGGISEVTDPSGWQRKTRADRPLPGREGG